MGRNGSEPVGGQDYPVKVLHEDKHQGSRRDRPARDKLDLFRKGRGAFGVVYVVGHLSSDGKVSKPRLIVLHILLSFPDAAIERCQHRRKEHQNEKGQHGWANRKDVLRPEDLRRRSRWRAPATPAWRQKPRMAKPKLSRVGACASPGWRSLHRVPHGGSFARAAGWHRNPARQSSASHPRGAGLAPPVGISGHRASPSAARQPRPRKCVV